MSKKKKEEKTETGHSEEQASEENGRQEQQLWDKYLRLAAEFDNARKRWSKERLELIRFANFDLLRDIIIVADEMEHALKMVQQHSNIEQIAEGLEIMHRNLVSILQKKGLKVIESVGKKFDPHLHEIVCSKEVEDEEEEHLVLEEAQKGYILEDRVLRTAKVVVGIFKQTAEDKKGEGRETKDEAKDSSE